MAQQVKRAFKYRFYPTDEQAAELSRTFGCVRKVYDLALGARCTAWSAEQRRIGYAETSALLTGWKKAEELAFLAEVSCVPLQQSLRHLQGAFVGFWGERAAYPRFKSRKRSRASAEYTRSGFRYRDGQLTLAKVREPLAVVWSRPLPEGVGPTTVTVSRDAAGRWHVSILCDDGVNTLPPAVDTGRGGLRAVGVDAGPHRDNSRPGSGLRSRKPSLRSEESPAFRRVEDVNLLPLSLSHRRPRSGGAAAGTGCVRRAGPVGWAGGTGRTACRVRG